jgi:hypothetical protein
MRAAPFTRPTILAAVELFELHTQASFDQAVLRLGLENDIPSDAGLSVKKKCALLGRIVMQHSTDMLTTLDGSMTLPEAVVREAVGLTKYNSQNPRVTPLVRGLSRDGYSLTWDEESGDPQLRSALPEAIDLPATDDEVRQLLKHFGFNIPLGHLEQAIEAHTRGDWAAANAQLRTFLEGMLDAIAIHLLPSKAEQLPTSENRRALLATIGFLALDRNEWSADGKNYINGLFKMLHTDGSHPGLSDEDHCTFRLHVVLVTARTFLRRLQFWA